MKLFKLLSIAFANLLIAGHVALASQDCPGRNLFAELRTSEPEAFAAISKSAAAVINAGSLYWKITPPNGAAPSYLLGTAHVTDARIATVKDNIRDQIAKSQVLALELSEAANRRGMSATLMSRTDQTLMPEGQSLWDLLPDHIEDGIRRNPLLAAVPPEQVERFQPWLVMTVTSTPVCEEIRKQTRFTLDEALAQTAQIAGVDIAGLETLDEQLGAFASLSLQDQADMLAEQTAIGISPEDNFRTVIELYLSRRITALEPLYSHIAAKKGMTQKPREIDFMESVNDKRNITMAERAAPLINDGGAFIAVGAMHLAGEEGIIELLRQAGYTVTPAE